MRAITEMPCGEWFETYLPRGAVRKCLATVLLLAVYLTGATYQGFVVNVRPTGDQEAYLEHSRGMKMLGSGYTTDRNRMPVYSWIQSFFYQEGMSEMSHFRRAKLVNMALSVILLFLIWVVLRKLIAEPGAITITLITAFSVFMIKAGWFYTELLYYFLSFLLFVLCVNLLKAPTYSVAAGAGVVAGIAHLTKASVLPGLLLFLSFLVLRGVLSHVRRQSEPSGRSIFRSILTPLIVLVFFLAVIYPYIATSKRQFGRYFYNVNSTFYMWYDSWEEATQGTGAHGDRFHWPDMPADEIPSFRKYWSEHSVPEMAYRVVRGFARVGYTGWVSYGYHKYVVLFVGFAALLLLQNRHAMKAALYDPGYFAVAAFASLYFLAYLFLFSWYSPIAGGSRFLLTLFLPLMYGISHFCIWAEAEGHEVRICGQRITWNLLQYAALLVLFMDVLFEMPGKIVRLEGGG